MDLGKHPGGKGARGIVRYLAGELEIPPDGIQMLLDLYDGEIFLADRLFGQVFEVWARQRPESIVVVTSGHGEAFGEHGFIEHRGNVYPEVVHVPLVIAAPGRLPIGKRISTPVQLQDVYPTLLDLAGIEPSPPGSLVPIVSGAARKDPILAAAWPTPAWAKLAGPRFGDAWFLYRVGNDALLWHGEESEIYDLGADPRMTRNLSLRADEIAALHFTPDARTSLNPIVLSEHARERLHALGYLRDAVE